MVSVLEYLDLSQLLDTKIAPAPLRQRQAMVIMLIRYEQMNNEGYEINIIDGDEVGKKEK